MFKNILHDPLNANDQEIEAVNSRRHMEKQLILDRDQDANADRYWFMISSEWLYQWKCFVSNKISSSNNNAIV